MTPPGSNPDARADNAERAIRAGGLLGSDGELIPLVRLAAEADMTSAQRAACHDRLAAVLAPDDLAAAARHLLWGEGRIPDAPRILADAAIRASLSAPQMFDRLVDRATQVGLPGSEASVLRALGAFTLAPPGPWLTWRRPGSIPPPTTAGWPSWATGSICGSSASPPPPNAP